MTTRKQTVLDQGQTDYVTILPRYGHDPSQAACQSQLVQNLKWKQTDTTDRITFPQNGPVNFNRASDVFVIIIIIITDTF